MNTKVAILGTGCSCAYGYPLASQMKNHISDFAIGKTISAGGDCDTNAAIVGGIVALSAGRRNIPLEWLNTRERIHVL